MIISNRKDDTRFIGVDEFTARDYRCPHGVKTIFLGTDEGVLVAKNDSVGLKFLKEELGYGVDEDGIPGFRAFPEDLNVSFTDDTRKRALKSIDFKDKEDDLDFLEEGYTIIHLSWYGSRHVYFDD